MGEPVRPLRVLVMDDEQVVRNVANVALTSLGHSAEFAKDGQQALEMYAAAARAGKPYDVVLADLIVPGGMGGEDMIENLLRDYPNAVAVVSSGSSKAASTPSYLSRGFKAVLHKPYRLSNIAAILEEVAPR